MKLRVFPACLLLKLLPRVPFSGQESFFVKEARRSGVCVTKMAQGRRPAFCCLSEECLLSGAGGNRWGAGTEKSGALKGPKGRNSPPMPNKYPLAAFVALSPPSNIEQVPTGRVPQVGSITRVDVVFCFVTFCHVCVVEPEVGHRSSSALVLLSPPNLPGIAGCSVLFTRPSLCSRVTVISVHFVWLSSGVDTGSPAWGAKLDFRERIKEVLRVASCACLQSFFNSVTHTKNLTSPSCRQLSERRL